MGQGIAKKRERQFEPKYKKALPHFAKTYY
jgi:hypothetical protein